MIKTFDSMKSEVMGLLDNYHQNIKTAFMNHGNELVINIKLTLKTSGGVIELSPALEFYPMPKTRSEAYKVKINENQIEMFPDGG
jgi:hypothetical protein